MQWNSAATKAAGREVGQFDSDIQLLCAIRADGLASTSDRSTVPGDESGDDTFSSSLLLALRAFQQYISFNFGSVCFVGVKALFFTSQKNPKYHLCLPDCVFGVLVASLALGEISVLLKS